MKTAALVKKSSVVSSSARRRGGALVLRRLTRSSAAAESDSAAVETEERFRLNNLSPEAGSRKAKKRIGRGYGAGQGGSAGKGMRGQNARSGGGTRPGFEGGQNPLYRRLPKLRGIAGGKKQNTKNALPSFSTLSLSLSLSLFFSSVSPFLFFLPLSFF